MSDTHTSNSIREALSRRLFTPGPLDFFVKPVFLIRRPFYRALREHASSISG